MGNQIIQWKVNFKKVCKIAFEFIKISIYYSYFIRLEKSTRTLTGKLPANRAMLDTSRQTRTNVIKTGTTASPTLNSKQIVAGHKATTKEIKEKMEQELQIQKERHKKRPLEMQQSIGENITKAWMLITLLDNVKKHFYLLLLFMQS